MSDPKRYRSIQEVWAVPINEHDYLMSIPGMASVPGTAPRNGYRHGYKIKDSRGRTSFVPKDEFEADYQEVSE